MQKPPCEAPFSKLLYEALLYLTSLQGLKFFIKERLK